ncbi:methylglyoxal synthase [Streptomyces sp. I05A-00742]|uniref:methylglyoxal synthase n=1 Tax=Streptomyces sp. I05A-00742 TaxID=2732853 RepID=UPI001BB1258B|nr:methylglyoxal synthase [Streptomyces sp. I05A-00742]
MHSNGGRRTGGNEPQGAPDVVALVAHDAKKGDLLAWAERHRELLRGCRLVSTRTTGDLLAERLGLTVRRVASGPMGGDQQIGAMIVEDRIALLVFFTDPLRPQPHDCDVRALNRLAVVHDVPTAPNPASADLLLADICASIGRPVLAEVDIA